MRLPTALTANPEKYFLGVTLVSPDQAFIDLYKNGRHVETVAEVTPLDLSHEDMDWMGRIKPQAIWSLLQSYAKYVFQSKGVIPQLPDKADVFQGQYLEESIHPKVLG
jgi:hypothetical protein